MQFQCPIHISPLVQPITHTQPILMVGSCFTEHIGNFLTDAKFNVLQNPNGILFDPLSVCQSLLSYVQPVVYTNNNVFEHQDIWYSWQHHSRFSGLTADAVVQQLNHSQAQAHQFLKNAQWLFITLGSSFSYQLVQQNYMPVANCHKVPGTQFKKHLCTIDETVTALDGCLYQLFKFNPNLQVIFTISPVRHLRDGVVDNNRSKARLVEAVHHLVNKFNKLYYFPAYELVVDVLRDYRFYDVDLAHPNYAATQFVMEHFTQFAFSKPTQDIVEKVKAITTACKHKSRHPQSAGHQQFLRSTLVKMEQLSAQYDYLNFVVEEQMIRQQLV